MKKLLFCLSLITFLLIYIIVPIDIHQRIFFNTAMTLKNNYDFVPELGIDEVESDNNIFFYETSVEKEGFTLNVRQACAVESAAQMNPFTNVYLLFLNNSEFSNNTRPIVKHLFNYHNIKIRYIQPKNFMKNTPLEEWYAKGALKKSRWPNSHMSDMLRYLTLWKYGGIYLDLDVIVQTSLENLTNFAGAEDSTNVAAGVIGFDMSELGRRIADACVQDFKENFRGDRWVNNGPGVITRTLQKYCNGTKHARNMTTARCHGFTVYPPSVFYPIHYSSWQKYFNTKDVNKTMEILSKAKTIHVWNKLSRAKQVPVDSDVPYAIVARNYCPYVFNSCKTTF